MTSAHGTLITPADIGDDDLDVDALMSELDSLLEEGAAGDEQLLAPEQEVQQQQQQPQQSQQSQQSQQQQQTDTDQQLLEEIRKLRESIAARNGNKSGIKLDIPKVDDTELGQLAQYRDKLEKLAKAAVGSDMQQVVEELNKAREEYERLAKDLEAQRQEQFARTLRSMYPDIDQLSQDPTFQAYLQQPAPLSGGRFTIGQMLADAYDSQDIDRVKEIIDTFKARQSPSAYGSRPPVHAAPGALTGSGPLSGAQAAAQNLEEKYVRLAQDLIRAYRDERISYEDFVKRAQKLQQLRAQLP